MKKKIIALLICCLTLIPVFTIGASALTVAPLSKYDSKTSKTFVAVTGKSKGSITFYSMKDTTQPGTKAPIMLLTVYNQTKTKTEYKYVTGVRWFGSQISSTLKLDKNTTYRITVSYLYDKSENWGTYGYGGLFGKTTGWYEGYWWISNVSKVTLK